MDAIVTDALTKLYNRRAALSELDLRVPTGSLFGFLGPNGAGKTTAIRLLLGLLRATSGRATVLGRDAWREGPRLRRDVGYLPGEVRFHEGLTGRQTLAFLNAARRTRCDDQTRRLADRFELDLEKRIRNYSRGMKQKLGLIQALMHRPKLLILDEPTSALDPLVRELLNEELRQAAADGRTVLFSSHTLSEVEALCDHIAIVRGGRLVEQEKISVLRARAVRHVEVAFERAPDAISPAPAALRVIEQSDGRLSGTWSGPVQPLLAWLAQQRVRDVSIAPPDLVDLFKAYYVDSSPEDGR
jgi:ABC-2 type transport system ATP-binding protein